MAFESDLSKHHFGSEIHEEFHLTKTRIGIESVVSKPYGVSLHVLFVLGGVRQLLALLLTGNHLASGGGRRF